MDNIITIEGKGVIRFDVPNELKEYFEVIPLSGFTEKSDQVEILTTLIAAYSSLCTCFTCILINQIIPTAADLITIGKFIHKYVKEYKARVKIEIQLSQ